MRHLAAGIRHTWGFVWIWLHEMQSPLDTCTVGAPMAISLEVDSLGKKTVSTLGPVLERLRRLGGAFKSRARSMLFRGLRLRRLSPASPCASHCAVPLPRLALRRFATFITIITGFQTPTKPKTGCELRSWMSYMRSSTLFSGISSFGCRRSTF
ncbi:uncharacterized protein BO72DRAFT_155045 [Aspergillus fijiensis CBS 313.89]|uniref:Uncharacterized protein n=1 Tax=Aspergillus fijiensis CBS 313.89 TaxID=1448319 RepID=A0A8G1W0B2_9EURO|nr:uncharacterized protein BO72DRAFT_155045 [Aspergillus fijiensis CBS 313.89]RAK75844.1 hypothetical protein BO72DRAFT_155045 [Aspergillus fijiensis CBS 313.89]